MHTHVVSGSIALDRILVTDALFADHLLPDQLHRISLALTMGTLRESWGGTGANIAYALAQLGEHPLLVGAIGQDHAPALMNRWDILGVDHQGVRTVDAATAVATIFTDREHNQITGFHPGALAHSHTIQIVDLLPPDPTVWTILAPEDPRTMMAHATTLTTLGRSYLFDPGQAMSLLTADQLQHAIAGARGVLVNDYEMKLLTRSTGHDEATLGTLLAQRDGALIVTQGSRGCEVWMDNSPVVVPVARAKAVVDPTGCGDAFRAGLLYGLARQQTWPQAAQMGAATAAIQIAHEGAQTYTTSEAEVLALKAISFTNEAEPARRGPHRQGR